MRTGKQNNSTVTQSATPYIDDHQLKNEEVGLVG